MISRRLYHAGRTGALAILSACGGGAGPDPIKPPAPPDPLRIEAVTPTAVISVPMALISPTPTVRVSNSTGPQSGVSVSFRHHTGSVNTVQTDQSGEARDEWRAGATGLQSLTAKLSTGDSVVFTAEIIPAVPANIQFVEHPGVAAVGSATSPIVVWVLDSHDRSLPGVEVTFSVESGGGVIAGSATATTDGQGRASLSSWQLGPSAPLQQLRASAGSFSNVLDIHGAPVLFEAVSDTVQRGHTGKLAPIAPAVRAIDALGQPMPDVPVAFVLPPSTSGPFSYITGPDGIVRLTDWVAAVEPGDNLVSAETVGWPSRIGFRLIGVLPGPARAEILSGSNQRGQVGNFLGPRPAVRFYDSTDIPIRLLPVTWSISSGTTLQHLPALSNYQGISAAEGWRLGMTPGPVSVTVTADGIAPVTWTAEADPLPTGNYDIDIRIIDSYGLSAADSAEVLASATRWTRVLRTDLPPVTITAADSVVCGDTITGTIDDLRINVIIQHIDGPGNVIGSVAPCVLRAGSLLPAVGLIWLDAADFVGITPGLLGDAMAHQIGHILGIGMLWVSKNLVDPFPPDGGGPAYVGPFARTAFHGLAAPGEETFSRHGVPISGGYTSTGGPFSATLGHLINVGPEMMAVTVQPGLVLSAISVAALRDLGYAASDAAAEPFTFPAFLRSLMGNGRVVSGHEVMPTTDIWIVHPRGRAQRVSPLRH